MRDMNERQKFTAPLIVTFASRELCHPNGGPVGLVSRLVIICQFPQWEPLASPRLTFAARINENPN